MFKVLYFLLSFLILLGCSQKQADLISVSGAYTFQLVKEGEGIVYVKGKAFPNPEKLPWINDLNWNMDSSEGKVADETDLKKVLTKNGWYGGKLKNIISTRIKRFTENLK